jgi:predicted metal-binding membrane protein
VSSTNPGAAATAPQLRPVFSREILIVLVALALAALLAWAWLLRAPAHAMGAMSTPGPLSAAYLLPAFAMWAIMMVAMMVPSAAPMILLHARIGKAPTQGARSLHTLLFALAYVLVWIGFSALAALAQALLVQTGVLSAVALSVGNGTLAAILLLVTGVYELTAAKRVCLDKCQSPLMFMLRQFQPGAAGAVRLGILHGFYCLGCCWALMLLLFVGGVMNLAWVALLGIVIVGEKFAPRAWRADRLVAAALSTGAIAVLLG